MSDSESDWSDCPELEEHDEVAVSLFDTKFTGSPEQCLENDKARFSKYHIKFIYSTTVKTLPESFWLEFE